MVKQEKIYQSILLKLSLIPLEYLAQVDTLLQSFIEENQNRKAANRQKILALAGSWGDMNEDEFQAYLQEAKRSGSEAFAKETEL